MTLNDLSSWQEIRGRMLANIFFVVMCAKRNIVPYLIFDISFSLPITLKSRYFALFVHYCRWTCHRDRDACSFLLIGVVVIR